MILADTSIWIEYLRGKEPIYSRFHDFLSLGRIYSLPWIFGELLQGARDETDVSRILSFWNEIPKPEPMDLERIWIDAGIRSRKHGLISKGVGLTDVAIVQAARSRGAVIWTLDRKLQKAVPAGHRFS